MPCHQVERKRSRWQRQGQQKNPAMRTKALVLLISTAPISIASTGLRSRCGASAARAAAELARLT
jgi:hypothetical protein